MDNLEPHIAQLKLLAHALAEGLLLFDRKGVVQYLNPEAERLLGWKMKETVGIRTYRDLLDPSKAYDAEMCAFERVLTTQTVVRVDKEKIYKLDGSPFFSRIVISPIAENRIVVGCIAALSNISESIHLREKLQKSLAEIQELKYREHREGIIYGITRRILSRQFIPEICQYLCEELVEAIGYPVAYVALKEEDGSARIVAQCGLTEAEIRLFRMRWDDSQQGESGFGRAIRSNRPQIYNLKDSPFNQPWHEIYKKLSLRSAAIFPVSSNKQVVGVLALYSQREEYFNFERVEKIRSIADQLDLAERVASQRALRESEEQLRELFETMNSAVAVFRISEDGQDFICTDINRAAEKVENISRQQAIGSSMVQVFPLIKELGLMKRCFQVFHTGERVHFPAVFFKNQRATGWSEGVIYKLSTGKIVFLYDEVSQRVLYENALWQEKERAQVTLASIGDAVLTTDVHGNITYLNPVAEEITGWKNEEAQGLRIECVFDIFHEGTGQSMVQPVWRCLREDRVIELSNHAVLRHRSGQKIYYIDDSAAPIRDRDGQVIGAVLVFHDVSEKRELQRRLLHQAQHDALTNLPNRQLFKERVDQAILHACRQQERVAVFFIDLDGFKLINDTLGHSAGDSLLYQVGERFKTTLLRQEDMVARQGGDEFLVLLPNLHLERQAAKAAQKLLNIFNVPFRLLDQEVYLTVSIGIALYPADGENSEVLIQHADMAMYQVKSEGGNDFTFFTCALNERLTERLALQNEMRSALEKNEFILHYQPQYRLSDGQLCGMEALVRWQHPKRGLLLPGKFISIAEKSGFILPLGEWILRTACVQNKLWQDMGYLPVPVSVNLSARQFRQKDLVEQVARILEETGLDPKWLALEITESLSMENVTVSVDILQKLKNMGIFLSIDDFGTGFSSLSYLSRFPLNSLKIDRSFISVLKKGLEEQVIVLTIIQLAKNLGLNVIAEGVETETQLDFLRTMGCYQVQGFFLAKPVPVEEMGPYLLGQPNIKNGS